MLQDGQESVLLLVSKQVDTIRFMLYLNVNDYLIGCWLVAFFDECESVLHCGILHIIAYTYAEYRRPRIVK